MRKLYTLCFLISLTIWIGSVNAQGRLPFPQAFRLAQRDGWKLATQQTDDYYQAQWRLSSRFVYYYSDMQSTQVDSIYLQQYSTVFGDWIPIRKFMFTYTDNALIASITTSELHAGVSQPIMRATYQYDDQMRPSSYRQERFADSTWTLNSRMTAQYLSDTDFTFYYYFTYQGYPPQWNKHHYACDSQGRIDQIENMVSSDSVSWTNNTKEAISYHPQDDTDNATQIAALSRLLPLSLFFDADMIAGSKQEQHHLTFTNSTWQESTKAVYYYNAALIQTSKVSSHFTGTDWQNAANEQYNYDTNTNLSQSIQLSWINSVWTNVSRDVYSWTSTTADSDENIPRPTASLLAYPNPFTSSVCIVFPLSKATPALLSIYNVKGECVFTKQTTSNSSIIWNGRNELNGIVADGIYFVRVVSPNQVLNTRLVKLAK